MTAKTQTPLDLVLRPEHSGMLGSLRQQRAELLDQIRTMEERIASDRRADAALAAIVAGDGDSGERARAQAERGGLAHIIRQDQDRLAAVQARYDALTPSVHQIEEERGRLLRYQQEHSARLAEWAEFEADARPYYDGVLAMVQKYRRARPNTTDDYAKAAQILNGPIYAQDQRRDQLARIAARLAEIGE